ncbi:MAG: 50S ribosomal protein L20 [Candidatus Pacebacteria bacterium]|nr:50S ribosomal protein L20 [Candidatus Paceibacterota bacterium]
MPRTSSSTARRRRHKKVLKQAKGFRGSRKNLYRQATNAVDRAMAMAYSGRKQKKRQYRRLWTVRINAACRSNGITYSDFIHGLKLASIDLNRKTLAAMAVDDPEAFSELVTTAQGAIAS